MPLPPLFSYHLKVPYHCNFHIIVLLCKQHVYLLLILNNFCELPTNKWHMTDDLMVYAETPKNLPHTQ